MTHVSKKTSFSNLLEILQPGHPPRAGVFPRLLDDPLKLRIIEEAVLQVFILVGQFGKNGDMPAVVLENDILLAGLLHVG